MVEPLILHEFNHQLSITTWLIMVLNYKEPPVKKDQQWILPDPRVPGLLVDKLVIGVDHQHKRQQQV